METHAASITWSGPGYVPEFQFKADVSVFISSIPDDISLSYIDSGRQKCIIHVLLQSLTLLHPKNVLPNDPLKPH